MAKNAFLTQAKRQLLASYGLEKGEQIAQVTLERFNELCEENSNEPKAMHAHTWMKIYPCIAILDAQIANKINREDALKFMVSFIEMRSHNYATMARTFMKVPFIYKKMPKFFGKMTKKTFGTKQRFDAVFYEISNDEMRFDMTKCPYNDLLAKYGYPEITKAFCKADDIVYGNMHPKLIWGRTKTIGEGDDVCNFKLTVKK